MKYCVLSLSLLIISSTAHCEVYKWTDDKGNTHFGDRKPIEFQVEKIKLKINTYTNVTYEESTVSHSQNVVMYSTSWCGYCKKARTYFERKNITYADYDIEKNSTAKEQYKAMGATGVPVILVGKKRMNGFSEKGFENIYN